MGARQGREKMENRQRECAKRSWVTHLSKFEYNLTLYTTQGCYLAQLNFLKSSYLRSARTWIQLPARVKAGGERA